MQVWRHVGNCNLVLHCTHIGWQTKTTNKLDSICWFSTSVAPPLVFGQQLFTYGQPCPPKPRPTVCCLHCAMQMICNILGWGLRVAMTLKFEPSRNFCTVHQKSLIILYLTIRKLLCSQTNRPSNKPADLVENIHLATTMLRRWRTTCTRNTDIQYSHSTNDMFRNKVQITAEKIREKHFIKWSSKLFHPNMP